MESFQNLINTKKPAIFTLQETKVPTKGLIKEGLENYETFELIRETNPRHGGGLCIGVLANLNPVLKKIGDDSIECIAIELPLNKNEKLVVVNGYGPQEHANNNQKDKFWEFLELEAIEAKTEGKFLIIQIDSNSWAGPKLIPGDPKKINQMEKDCNIF